MDWGADISGHL